MRKRLLYGTAAMLAVIAVLVVFRIAFKIVQGSEKSKVPVYTVAGMTLQKESVELVYKLNGNAEGISQVSVSPLLPGKFNRYTVAEGDRIKKGQIIAYIDRDMAGGGYELEPVKATVDGAVLRLFCRDKGEYVSSSREVAEIGDGSTIKAEVPVGPDEVRTIIKGMTAKIYPAGRPDMTAQAVVDSMTPFVSGDNYEGRLVVKAPNPGGQITIGTNLDIEVDAGPKQAFMVRERAVLLGQNRAFVFVNDNGTAREREVKTGYIRGDYIEISGDIKEGEQIVINGAFMLNDGARIDFKSEISQK